ncbi:MAG: hypothetical protein HYZ53_24185 [Planctomycetes bacterium]|nr:hypothetical protein [Planctomycetota bacterium]
MSSSSPAGPAKIAAAAGLLVLGLALSAVAGWRGYARMTAWVTGLARVVGPGRAEVTLARAGTYTIYYEWASTLGGRTVRGPFEPPPLRCSLTSKATGQEVRLEAPSSKVTYEFSCAGRNLFDFTVDQPGVYLLESSLTGAGGPSEVVLAVGEGFGERLGGFLGGIFFSICCTFASALPVSILLFLTFFRKPGQAGKSR